MIDEVDITRYKYYLKEYLNRYHNISDFRKAFRCLNPNHEDRHPSMYYSTKYNICKCFSCGKSYDIFDLIKIDYGLTNFRWQYNKLAELFNEEYKQVNTEIILNDNYVEKDYSSYFNYCFRKIGNTSYLTSTRGIAEHLQIKYRIGYDEERSLIIFPINEKSYFARSTINKGKYKSKGTSYLFNEKLLQESTPDTLIYITESIIDALSLETINPDLKIISLNGTTNIKRLLLLAKENNYKGSFIIALDNDSVGKTTSELLKLQLDSLNIPSYVNSLISTVDGAKDINEALIKNKEKLERNIKYFNEQYQIIVEKTNLRKEQELDCV